MLIGPVAYVIYRLVKRAGNLVIALGAAGIAGSMTNTVLVMNMIYFFFGNSYAAAKGISTASQGGTDALYGFIMGVIGVNGVPEAIVAAILTAAIARSMIHVVGKKL